MATYLYRCPDHGQVEIEKPMSQAAWDEDCFVGGCTRQLKRVYTGASVIMRPQGWNLRPGDHGYWDFNREQELGQIRQGITADERRLDDFPRQEPPKIEYSVSQMRELRNLSEIVDRNIRESSDIPELIREGV